VRIGSSVTQSSTVEMVAMLLVLAGDHHASAYANAKTLLRLFRMTDDPVLNSPATSSMTGQ